jgi:carboxyl-terminal processing protease
MSGALAPVAELTMQVASNRRAKAYQLTGVRALAIMTIGAMALCAHGQLGDATGQTPSTELTPTQRERVIIEIDQSIRRNFAHWQGVLDLNYAQAYQEYRVAALAAPNRRTFSLLSEAFVASLQNGHTQFNDDFLYRSDPGNLGFALGDFGGWVLTRSRRPEAPTGVGVIAINGEPFENFYQRVKPQLNASSDRARRHGLTSYPALFPVRFELTFEDGRTVSIDRAHDEVAPAASAPQVVHRWVEQGSIAYLKIGSFVDSGHERLATDAATGPYSNARSLIIDLRGNSGGNTPSRLGRRLLGRDWQHWNTSQPDKPAPAAQRTRPSAPRYILLIDRGCGSACEDFAMPFSLSQQAVLVGETTGGTSGQPVITDWGNGMSLWVSSRRQWFPDGREFEGVGIAADIPILLKPADFAVGARDRILECALSIGKDNAKDC